MSNFLTKVIGDKKEWKNMEARANALPSDYRTVYGLIKPYMWKFTTGDGMGTIAVLKEVLALFEASAAEGKSVLDVTGEDVAAFCDQRLRGAPTYVDKGRAALNRDVRKKVGSGGPHA